MKHKYLINLLGGLSERQPDVQRRRALEEEADHPVCRRAHQMFDFVDTIMYGTAVPRAPVGWETFFITTGCRDLTIQVTCRLVPGRHHPHPALDRHQMSFTEPTVYRGIFHDINMSGTLRNLAYIREVNPKQLEGLASFQRYLMRADNIIRETPVSVRVDKSEVPEVRSPDRPLRVFELEGVTMKQYTGRWENNGLTELWKAEMEDGFTVEYYDDNPNTDMFYIIEGDVRFKVAGEEFTATNDCIVKIPGYAPRSFTAQGKAVMFDLAGLTHWLTCWRTALHQNKQSRAPTTDAMAAERKYNCRVASFGICNSLYSSTGNHLYPEEAVEKINNNTKQPRRH